MQSIVAGSGSRWLGSFSGYFEVSAERGGILER